jgi:ketosteroid isomerase-like protein
MEILAPLTVVENAYRSWAEGDYVEMLCAMSPDVRWHQEDGLHATEFVGRSGVAERIKDVLSDFRWLEITPLRWTVHGQLVAVVGEYAGEGRTTGFSFEDKFTHVWRVENGRGVEIGLYRTPALAMRDLDAALGDGDGLAAAGLD